jgi:hypothetical protein
LGNFFQRCKLCISNDKKRIGLKFGRLFHVRTWSPLWVVTPWPFSSDIEFRVGPVRLLYERCLSTHMYLNRLDLSKKILSIFCARVLQGNYKNILVEFNLNCIIKEQSLDLEDIIQISYTVSKGLCHIRHINKCNI